MKSKELSAIYSNRFAEKVLPRKHAIWKIICKTFLQNYINPNDTIVDIACGHGEFLNNINAKRKIALDLNPDVARHLNEDVEFHLIEATELSRVLGTEVDVIFTSNFLEHLPNKDTLSTFLDEVHKSLRPGGKYLILGPNLRYLPGKYWDFYDHHLGLTHLSMTEILKIKRFEVEVCISKFLPYTTQGAFPTHPIFVWLYIHIPWLWRFLGKQFFIVAKKSN